MQNSWRLLLTFEPQWNHNKRRETGVHGIELVPWESKADPNSKEPRYQPKAPFLQTLNPGSRAQLLLTGIS